MTDPAAPHPEYPTPAAPQVEANPTAPQAGHPTSPRLPQLENLASSTASEFGHPAKPRTPWAESTPSPAAPQTDYSHMSQFEDPTDTLAQLAERIEDLTRVIARQATTIERLADEAKARDRRDRAGADLPLVLELFALHTDSAACATTAESPRERAAFEAIATRIERLIVGRGGTLVIPQPGDAFDSFTMEAADVTKTDDPALDRTVASVVQTGLTASGRSVRPAGVVVRRHH
ncbi:nucleotide exchange factor GrpE [Nocardia sp. CA-135398]|uniref:nucleotide exchange factor GrpE n=1 Tax=Nocardia sp. CA-135398 TaxID=3239977 RepID=UPI003D9924F8